MKETIAKFLKVNDFPFFIKDKNNKLIYCEDSNGFWSKTEYDQNGKLIYVEYSNGFIIDKRPKIIELTLEEIADKLDMNVKNLRIKD